jgi:Cu/Ag efflux protein CusF
MAAVLAMSTMASAQAPSNNARGRVTAIDTAANTITVQSGGWGGGDPTTSTIKVNGTTKYTVAVQGALTDIKVGQKVRVGGGPAADASTDNEVDARFIMIGGPGGGGGRRPGGGGGGGGGGGFSMTTGTVLTAPPDMTVTTSSGTVTVDTSDDTRIMMFKPGSLSDIKTGNMVMANLANGVATSIQAMPGFGGRGGGQHGGWRRNSDGGVGGGAPAGAPGANSGSDQ